MNQRRDSGENFQLLLTRYGIERLLYRISRSQYAEQFVLKGALLFQIWTGTPHRPTRDLDLLGTGEPSIESYEKVFSDICRAKVEDDGLSFDATSVQVGQIKEEDEYQGLRIKLDAKLQNAVIKLQVDIGFGDAVNPPPEVITYPGLLGFPTPSMLVYPKETVIAEKFQAMVALGMANSRLKDFFDVWTLVNQFPFSGDALALAMNATFVRRKTTMPSGIPLALTKDFAMDESKTSQWKAFQKRTGLAVDGLSLSQINIKLRQFFEPLLNSFSENTAVPRQWRPGGPWST